MFHYFDPHRSWCQILSVIPSSKSCIQSSPTELYFAHHTPSTHTKRRLNAKQRAIHFEFQNNQTHHDIYRGWNIFIRSDPFAWYIQEYHQEDLFLRQSEKKPAIQKTREYKDAGNFAQNSFKRCSTKSSEYYSLLWA